MTTVAAVVAVLAIGTGLASLTSRQVGYWKDEISLWSQAVRTFPTDGTARYNLGLALLQVGAWDGALSQFDIVARLPYRQTRLQAMRSHALIQLGRFEQAQAAHRLLAESAPFEPDVAVDWDCHRYNLGWLAAQQGAIPEAMGHFSAVRPGSEWHAAATTWQAQLSTGAVRGATADAREEGPPGYCLALVPISWRAVSG